MFRQFVTAALLFSLPSMVLSEEEASALQLSDSVVSLSAVQGKKSRGAKLSLKNTGSAYLTLPLRVSGQDVDAFIVEPKKLILAPHKQTEVNITLRPIRGAGDYRASLELGEQQVQLNGIGLQAFEGINEPSLARIVAALEMNLDVGSDKLDLDTASDTIGSSLAVARFRGIENLPVRVKSLARFSPPGKIPFGIVVEGEELVEWGQLDRSDKARPDNHQCLFPSINQGEFFLEKEAPAEAFSFYLAGHFFVSNTDSSLNEGDTIKHTARIWSVEQFQGKKMENAYLIGFEETKNGDYQDALFLLENVVAE